MGSPGGMARGALHGTGAGVLGQGWCQGRAQVGAGHAQVGSAAGKGCPALQGRRAEQADPGWLCCPSEPHSDAVGPWLKWGWAFQGLSSGASKVPGCRELGFGGALGPAALTQPDPLSKLILEVSSI